MGFAVYDREYVRPKAGYLMKSAIPYLCVLVALGLFLTGGDSVHSDRADEKIHTDTVTWWECSAIELNLSGKIVLIDPCFPSSRKASIILITHAHADHCHIPTIQRTGEVSGDGLSLVVASRQCEEILAKAGIEKRYPASRWEAFEHRGLTIETVPSFEGETDLGYVVRDPQSGISILHMGDNRLYSEDFRKIKDIDYLFLSMGKMSMDDMVKFVRAVKPAYLVPMHYRPAEGAFNPVEILWPPNPEQYIDELKKRIEDDGLSTEVLILYPRRETGIAHSE